MGGIKVINYNILLQGRSKWSLDALSRFRLFQLAALGIQWYLRNNNYYKSNFARYFQSPSEH